MLAKLWELDEEVGSGGQREAELVGQAAGGGRAREGTEAAAEAARAALGAERAAGSSYRSEAASRSNTNNRLDGLKPNLDA